MNFLTSLFGRLFGKQDQAPQAPLPQPAPQNQPQIQVQSAPSQSAPSVVVAPSRPDASISPVSLVKAPSQAAPPQAAPDTRNIFQKIGDYFNPSVGGLDQNNAFYNTVEKLNGGNSPIGQNGYFNKQVIQPIEQGVTATKESPSLLGKGAGLLGALRGAFNATPFGTAANSAVSSVAGLIKAARGQDVNPLQEINQNTQISEGLGADNPVAKAAIDILANTAAINPKGAAAGIADLVNLRKAQSAADVATGLISGGKNIIGLNPETSGFANQPLRKAAPQEAVPNPPIATLTPRENLTAGQLNNPYGDQTVEDAMLQVPTFQRNLEAAQLQKAESAPIQVAPPTGTMTDITGKTLTPQEVQGMHLGVVEPPQLQPNIRPIGLDISAPLRKAAPAEAPLAPEAANPVPETAPSAPLSEVQPINIQKTIEQGSIVKDPSPAEAAQAQSSPQAPETAPQTPVSSEIPQEAPVASGNAPVPARPTQEGADLKAPRQAQILLDKEANGPDKEAIRASLPQKEQASLDALQNRGAARTAALGDDSSVAAAYANQPAITGPEDYYAALEAAKRLSGLTDEASVNARSNIYNAMVDYASSSGLNLRSTQILWEDMPVELKVSTVLKGITRTLSAQFGPDSPEVTALSDPAKRSAIESRLNFLLSTEQSIQDGANAARGILEQAKENPSAFTAEQIDAAGKQLNDAKDALSKNAGDFAKFRDELVPSNIGAAEKVGNAQRVAMLSSLSGRLRDIIQTPLTGAREVLSSKVSGAIGSLLNKVSGTPGKFTDQGLRASDLVSAVPSALKKAGQNVAQGDTYASIDQVLNNIKRTPDRTDLSGATKGFFSRLTKAGTNLANDTVAGLKSGEVSRQLRQVGQQAGLAGDDLEKFVKAGSYDPPADILAKAQHLQDAVNNVNSNPITQALKTINQGIGQIPGVGTFLKNALDPFPTWLGGNIWNTVTDRNVVANTVKFVLNLEKDPQYAVDQLSKALTGAGELYGAGYLLTQSGVLSETDANGDSYGGLYFHLGNRYIPVGSAGGISANIILGNTAYKALNGNDPAAAITKGGQDLYNSLNIDNVAGGSSYLSKAQSQFGSNPTQAAATVATGIGSQFIPAAFGDINSVLNQTPLNPTGEAADTKVENPNSPSGHATDFVKTAEAQLQNKIPILSQQLPRDGGKTAPDFFDRVSQGNHEGDGQIQAAADEKSQVASAYKSLQDQGVFTPKIRAILDGSAQKVYDTLSKGGDVTPGDLKKLTDSLTRGVSATSDSRFLEDGDYASNLAALRVKRDQLAADPTTTEKALGEYDTQIKRGEVYQKLKVPYQLASQYAKTSLAEWRNMGDPKKDTYDPEAYQQLFNLDKALSDAGASRNAGNQSQPLYAAKAASTGSGSGSGGVSSTVRGNRIGSIASISPVSLQKLVGHATGTAPLPTVPLVKDGEVVKKRNISVRKV